MKLKVGDILYIITLIAILKVVGMVIRVIEVMY